MILKTFICNIFVVCYWPKCYPYSTRALVRRCYPGHCDLFSEFWSSDSFRGYTAHIWLSSILLVFLGVKDFRKNEKGQQRLWRLNKGQRVNNAKSNYHFFLSTELLGILYSQIWLFLNFKVIKAKKAALVAKNIKLQTGSL